jgi:hypothetical protein
MIRLLSALDFQKYSPRTYILANSDRMSETKVLELEQTKTSSALQSGPQVREFAVACRDELGSRILLKKMETVL